MAAHWLERHLAVFWVLRCPSGERGGNAASVELTVAGRGVEPARLADVLIYGDNSAWTAAS